MTLRKVGFDNKRADRWTTPYLRLGRVVTGTSRLPAPFEPNPTLLRPPLPSQCPTESREGILPHLVNGKFRNSFNRTVFYYRTSLVPELSCVTRNVTSKFTALLTCRQNDFVMAGIERCFRLCLTKTCYALFQLIQYLPQHHMYHLLVNFSSPIIKMFVYSRLRDGVKITGVYRI